MVLDEVTLFEVHLDGAQFGKTLGGGSEKSAKKSGGKTGEKSGSAGKEASSGGSSRKRALVGGVLALAIFGVVAWRRRKGKQTTMDDYTDNAGGLADSDAVEIDDVDA